MPDASGEQTAEEATPSLWDRLRGHGRTIGAVAVAIAAIVTVFYSIHQIVESNQLKIESNRLQRAQLESHLEEVMMGLDRYFAYSPGLRRYFFAKPHRRQLMPPRGRINARAWSTAELIIDFADDVGAYVHRHKMARSDAKRWADIVGSYFDQSPVTRFAWTHVHKAYPEATACILKAPYGEEMRGWRWRSNFPPAPRETCG